MDWIVANCFCIRFDWQTLTGISHFALETISQHGQFVAGCTVKWWVISQREIGTHILLALQQRKARWNLHPWPSPSLQSVCRDQLKLSTLWMNSSFLLHHDSFSPHVSRTAAVVSLLENWRHSSSSVNSFLLVRNYSKLAPAWNKCWSEWAEIVVVITLVVVLNHFHCRPVFELFQHLPWWCPALLIWLTPWTSQIWTVVCAFQVCAGYFTSSPRSTVVKKWSLLAKSMPDSSSSSALLPCAYFWMEVTKSSGKRGKVKLAIPVPRQIWLCADSDVLPVIMGVT